jgi:ABC-type phosphate transport system substrate-binding protein
MRRGGSVITGSTPTTRWGRRRRPRVETPEREVKSHPEATGALARAFRTTLVITVPEEHLKSTFKLAGLALVATAAFGFGAAPALAASPGGVNCQANGHINGRGATFAKTAWNVAFGQGYRDEVCGTGAPVDDVLAPAGIGPEDHQAPYNYPAAEAFVPPLTGSGNGRTAMRCRTDAYAGTDGPYDTAQLAQLNGAPLNGAACPQTLVPPYNPQNPYANPAATTENIMTIPVAAGSVAFGHRFTLSGCGGVSPTQFRMTSTMVNLMMGGFILNWNDIRLRDENGDGVADINSGLINCTGAVTRIVRSDSSGTTQILKNYLKKINPGGALCDPAETWTILSTAANNTNWPTGAGCSPVVASAGNPGVVFSINDITNSFGYGDVADMINADTHVPKRFARIPLVRNSTNTAYVDVRTLNPQTGLSTVSNCNLTSALLPGGVAATNNQAVGLGGAGATWATDNAGFNYTDITNIGDKYPICGLTFELVFADTASAIPGLSLNQRQTLYSFSLYALSTGGQNRLRENYYEYLPSSWLVKLRAGLKANF